jgi:uncharacterized protein with WD repeat
VLVDFGAAKYATGTALGKTGTTIGSAGYAAPEQTFGQAVFASDIYGLGVTCIHLLTDIEPFELYNAMESAFVWRHHLGKNPMSEQLGRVLDKMTQSVVKQRYKTAEAAMQALGLKVGTQTSQKKPRPQINRKVIQRPTPSVRRQSGNPAPALKPSSPAKASPATTVQKVSPKVAYVNVSLITTICESQGKVQSIAISPDSQTLASGTDNSVIQLWDVYKGREIRVLGAGLFFLPAYSVRAVAFSPDGKILASIGGSFQQIKLWDVSTGREKSRFGEKLDSVFAIAFSPDGQTLASGGDGDYGLSRLWNVNTGQEKHTIKLISLSSVGSVIAFSPDGQTLVTRGYGLIKLWDIHTGQEKLTLSADSDYIFSVAFSPNGQTLASGDDRSIKLWDVSSGQEKYTLKEHSGWIVSVVFSPDGKTIATGSWDNTIKLWDTNTGQELYTINGHSDKVSCLAFTPKGQTLVSASEDKTIKIWRVNR